ncbi:flagellar hook-basal body complex protein [Devosia rhizoryzae]|uniref:Flagellar hook protein FlgE n=1 Tax=Devosia rhizoryzae TaxID=2774137 RepID=A0ABX7C7N0_9HYPH|nr:flagellar hook-basal body complex protein [Devosia rhizoryzae]QQR40264.1 flagellar hook-basal body complex protein [Devosia rhizoryzae]
MGIYGALSSAVTGLRAQSHALENISGNIANSQTTGYKRMETSFVDLIPDAPLKAQVPGAVLAQSRSTNNIQGDIQTSSNETFIALNTNGFFVVEPKVGQSDGNSVFAGSNYFTRRGDFEIDKDGLLVNGAGYYLKGLPIDPATGNISGSVPSVIKLSNAFLPANVTKTINYQANLPQLPKTANYKPTVPNSEMLQPWTFSNVSGTPQVPNRTGTNVITSLSPQPPRASGDTFVGTGDARTVINDGDVLAFGIGGQTYNLRFDTDGSASQVVTLLPGATPGTVAVGGTTSLRIAAGDLAGLHRSDTLNIGGTAIDFSDFSADAAGLEAAVEDKFSGSTATYNAATGQLDIVYAVGVRTADAAATGTGTTVNANGDVNTALASMQIELRALTGNNDLTVKLRNGKMEVFTGAASSATFSLASTRAAGTAAGQIFGLPNGSYSTAAINGANVADTPADLLVQNGQTMTVSVGGTTRNYRFDTDGSVTPGTNEVEINAGGTVAQMLAAIEADLQANGGVGASGARVRLEGGSVKIDFGDNHYYPATISGTAASAMGINGTFGAATGKVGNITAADADKFVAQSISGGAITVYAANGAPVNVQMRWAKVDSAATGGADTWNLFYLSDSTATGAATAWTNTGMNYQFDSNGSMVGTGTGSNVINNLTVNGVHIGEVELKHDTNGVSQFADVNGTVTVSTLNQNGYGAGEFLSVAITDSGRVVATYSNGERIEMAQVTTAQFNGVNSLKRLDGGVYQTTSESGEPIFDLSGSGIIGGALEASNTDISDEFTKLIITQQAYSAGTRIVSTADEMLQEALNMVR